MNLLAAITLPEYCERISDSFLGEPINLFTNLLFILSGIIAWLYTDKNSVRHKTYLKALTVLIGLIGLGSFIFHGAPGGFTILLDAIPIYIFIVLSLLFLLKKLTNSWNIANCIVVAFVFALVAISLLLPAEFLNGSFRHVLILLAIVPLSVFTYRKYGRIGHWLILIAGIYLIAIVARSIDINSCNATPFGTHFLWHTLSALASYFLIVFLVKLDQKLNYNTTPID